MPSTGKAFRLLIGVILLVVTLVITYQLFITGFTALGAANTITNIGGLLLMPVSLFVGFLGIKFSWSILRKLNEQKEQQSNA